MFWTCFGHVLDMCWTCFGYVLDMFWICVGHVWDMFWTYVGHCFIIFWTCFGHDWDMFGTEDVILSCNICWLVFLKIIICYLVATSQFWKNLDCFGRNNYLLFLFGGQHSNQWLGLYSCCSTMLPAKDHDFATYTLISLMQQILSLVRLNFAPRKA